MRNFYRFAPVAFLLAVAAAPRMASARDEPRPAPTVKQGSLELEVRGIQRSVEIRFGDEKGGPDYEPARIDFVARAAEGTRLAVPLCVLSVTKVTDTNGKEILQLPQLRGGPAPFWELFTLSMPKKNPPREITFGESLKVPRDAARRFDLVGEAQFAWITKSQMWSVPNPFEKQDETKEQSTTIVLGGVPVRYKLAIARPIPPSRFFYSGPGDGRTTEYRISILVSSQENPPRSSAPTRDALFFKLARLAPTLRLLDAQGRAFENSPIDSGGTRTIETIFRPTPEQTQDKATPARFEMEIATALEETVLPFEFKNLPLPTAEAVASK